MWWAAFVAWAASVALYAPGYTSTDSLFQLELAQSGRYHEQMPILMTTLWRGLLSVADGPFGMLIFHLALYWGGLALFFRHAAGPAWLRTLLVLLIGFFPAWFSLVGIIWKDISMLGALLLGFGAAAALHRGGSRWWWIVVCVCAIYAFDSRSNSIAAVVPLLAYALLGSGQVRSAGSGGVFRALALALVCVGLLYLARAAIGALVEKEELHLWQAVMVRDLGNMSHLDRRVLFPPDLFENRPVDLEFIDEKWRRNDQRGFIQRGTVEDGQPLYWLEGEKLAELRSAWLKVIREDPLLYLSVRFTAFTNFLAIPDDVRPTPWIFMRRVSKHAKLPAPEFVPSAMNRWVTDEIFIPLGKHGLVFRTYVYQVVAVLTLAAALVLPSRRRALVLALLASGLGYLSLWFVIVPNNEFRYALWANLAAVLALTLLLLELRWGGVKR